VTSFCQLHFLGIARLDKVFFGLSRRSVAKPLIITCDALLSPPKFKAFTDT
jgi:hypothetical protein